MDWCDWLTGRTPVHILVHSRVRLYLLSKATPILALWYYPWFHPIPWSSYNCVQLLRTENSCVGLELLPLVGTEWLYPYLGFTSTIDPPMDILLSLAKVFVRIAMPKSHKIVYISTLKRPSSWMPRLHGLCRSNMPSNH
jgi:hypothetical protein